VPKEVFSATLGSITIHTAEELRKLLSMPEGELMKKLADGTLKAQKIKDAWYVPEDVIAEQRKLTTRLAAAGGRAKESRRARNLFAACSAALVILIAGTAAYNVLGPSDVHVSGCDSEGLDRMVLLSIESSTLRDEIETGIRAACLDEGLSGDRTAYEKCSVFARNPGRGVSAMGELDGINTVTESETGLSCRATLRAVASFPIEYNVTVSKGVAETVSVDLR